ncbi:MAG: hypothetical protein JSW53_04005 [Candidatus Bathyarchaeota archaeon]|nr:MAG: hypothetical protein JSW53_04005 [Candidatus Bathyarchaeota archaeon]
MIRYVYLTKPPTYTCALLYRRKLGEDKDVSKKRSRDEALEAVDFIINVLKEHEKDLDRLADKMGTTLEQYGESGELAGKMDDVEGRLARLQTQISDLIKIISQTQESPTLAAHHGPPVIVRCRQWEDFKNLAIEAETVSYLQKETERTFQADALKGGRVLTYTGDFPNNSRLLKAWLSKELNIPEEDIFEGALAVG